MRGTPHPTTPTLAYVVEGPYGLNHEGFHVATASYHLEDNVGECPVYESRGAMEQESPEDEEEPVAGVALVGVSHGTECTDVCPVDELVSPNTVLPSVLELMEDLPGVDAYEGRELPRYCSKLVRYHDVLSRHGSLNEGRIFLDGRVQIPYDEADEGTVDRAKNILDAGDLSFWWNEVVEPGANKRTGHPYLDGKDYRFNVQN
ncbi:hypothetical protein CRG98_009954 [Punica granatum]|uniref:Uncharacterized protein n=1 Tax=Punica granatum TaxID=22663 RepID=A0A2I0KN12_PUNGR|nr:hypothetical protein CRG98_009954 [Punica granatum]